MKMKYIYVVSILAIAIIGSGCVDKISEKSILTEGKSEIDNLINKIIHDIAPPEVNTSGNIQSPAATTTPGNIQSPEATAIPGNIQSPETTTTPGNTSSQGTEDAQTEDKSVTKIFNIGDEYNMLGVNVKLVNITDYDNNAITLLINNVEYKYDSSLDTGIQANGIEIIDVVSSEDDKTAEITVDYIAR